ncbi:MAG: GIY-YIG nuclease family protein [bacterium]|nr:GIY-YIG nuclease family protein [bacterium]
MWHVYALKGKDKIYIGSTENLKRRIQEHTKGKTYSTRRMGKLRLIFCESFVSKIDALKQEKFYKTGYGREVLKGKLENTLSD